MDSKKVLIIGAGPAGLSAARVLSERGFKVEIFEAESKVGGMSKSLPMFNQIVDIGPHRFFSKDKRLNDFWHAHAREYEKVSRLTRIFYNRKFFYYPLRGFDALFKLGVLESSLCVLSYIKAKLSPFKGNSFESFVANAFGYRLYSIFFKSYTEKLWGIKCEDLDSDFAAQRIKGLNLYEAVKAAFFGGGGNKHKTLVDEFSYPKKGCGVVYENMRDEIIRHGGQVHCNVNVEGIITEGKKAVGIRTDRGEFYGDIVISSAPFSDMVLSLDELDSRIKELAKALKFRNTILVYVEVGEGNSGLKNSKVAQEGDSTLKDSNGKDFNTTDSKDRESREKDFLNRGVNDGDSSKYFRLKREIELFKDNWIYVHSKDTNTGRITNFANWTKDLQCGMDSAILCLEYWANDDDRLWNLSEKEIINMAEKDLLDSGLVSDSSLLLQSFVYKIHKSYPVYERGYKENLHKIYAALNEFRDLYFIGRNGSFKYNNQDHSILMGLACADKILGKECDLWNINTDYDYQEDSGKKG